MAFSLHKAPRGLLELFRLRTLGANPPQFGEAVTPTVDVSEFYASDLKLVSNSTAVVGAIGGVGIISTLTLTGPVRLHALGVHYVQGAAAGTNVTLELELNVRTGAVVLGSNFFAALNAGAHASYGLVIPGWVLEPPGVTISARASGTAAGADHAVQLSSLIDNITGSI